MSRKTITNALTVDVEDWYHVCGVELDREIPPAERRVRQNVERLLAIMAQCSVKATFFVLGSVAEQDPGLVPMIAAAGHEIASHGYSHRPVTGLEPEQFRHELRRTRNILERQSGMKPTGFRAPQWSLSQAVTPWAFNILREEEYVYDSSCNPLPFVGEPRGSRIPFEIETPRGGILELPPMVTPSFFVNLPSGGGWGFRFFPMNMIVGTVEKLNDIGYPAVLYVHPREVDPSGPRLKLPPLRSFGVYGAKSDAAGRLMHILRRFPFGTMEQLAVACQSV